MVFGLFFSFFLVVYGVVDACSELRKDVPKHTYKQIEVIWLNGDTTIYKDVREAYMIMGAFSADFYWEVQFQDSSYKRFNPKTFREFNVKKVK